MTETDSKFCRHCRQAIARDARVCQHCRSHQGLFSSAQDPRFLPAAIVVVLSALAAFAAFMEFVIVPDKHERTSKKESCRGLVVISDQTHDLKRQDDTDKLYVRVLIQNKSKAEISDPVVRVNVLNAAGNVIETFHRTMYGGSIPPATSSWFRVVDSIAVDPSKIASVNGAIESADCKAAW